MMLHKSNPMGGATWLLLGAAGVAAGLVGFHHLTKPPADPTGGSKSRAFTAPPDLQARMLAAWAIAGKPVQQDPWVRSQLGLFPGQVNYAQWAAVWTQVYGTYLSNGSWPTEAQVEAYLNAAVTGGT